MMRESSSPCEHESDSYVLGRRGLPIADPFSDEVGGAIAEQVAQQWCRECGQVRLVALGPARATRDDARDDLRAAAITPGLICRIDQSAVGVLHYRAVLAVTVWYLPAAEDRRPAGVPLATEDDAWAN